MKDQYQKLDYELPEYEDLDRYFQISSIENKEQLLRQIASKIVEKADHISSTIEEMLNPERFNTLHESNQFIETEKKEMLRVYRKLHYYSRKFEVLNIDCKEEECAGFIREFYKEWLELKPAIINILEKIRDSWNSDKKKKLELNYFG